MITDITALDTAKRYTYADYLQWAFEEQLELIKGKIFKMSPAPGLKHQRISIELARQIANYLHKKSCKVYHAPF
ncbi:restriction endonuclease, partial [Sphingobacteriales bacterium UPWRP_1]